MAKTRLRTVKQQIKDSKASQKREEEGLKLYNNLISVVPKKVLEKKNKDKSWSYGYNSDYDFVVISKEGTIGDVVEVQNLKIALPLRPKKVFKRSKKQSEQYWEFTECPKDLNRIKTIFQWNEYPNDFKNKWITYIDEEFELETA